MVLVSVKGGVGHLSLLNSVKRINPSRSIQSTEAQMFAYTADACVLGVQDQVAAARKRAIDLWSIAYCQLVRSLH